MKIHHIQTAKLTQNAYIEKFSRSFRNEVLDAYMLDPVNEVRWHA
ncbi:integrase core domain-containing protein [Oceaniferula spumae]